MVAPKAWKTLPLFLKHPVRSLSQASLSKKLWLSFSLLLLILFTGSWAALRHIRQIQNEITILVTVAEPLKEAILEMEINTLETADAVHQYLLTPQPRHKLRFDDSREDFRIFHAKFIHLASTNPHQLQLADQVNQSYLDFCDLGENMMDTAKKKHNRLNKLRKYAVLIDEFIDDTIQTRINRTNGNVITKLEAAIDIEINVHKALIAIESYAARSDPNLLLRYHDAQADYQNFRKMYQQTDPSTRELELINRIDDLFAKTIEVGNAIINHTDRLKNQNEKFTRRLEQIDHTLDDEIQPLIHAQTLNAARDSKAAAQKAAVILILLATLGLLVTVTSAFIISRQILRPVTELVKGTEIIAQNNLDHHIQIRSSGEFGHLADAFNQMVQNLKQSKGELVQHQQYLEQLIQERTLELTLTNEHLTLEIDEKKQAQESLRQSQRTNLLILQAIPDMLIRVNRNGIFKEVLLAKGFKPIWGKEKVIGKHLADILPTDLADQLLTAIEQAFVSQNMRSREYTLHSHDQKRWRESRIIPFTENEVFVMVRDITKRKKNEQALRQSEARLRDAERIAGLGHWDRNLLTDELHWSDEIYYMFGLDPKQDKPDYELLLSKVHPEDRQFVSDHVKAALEKNKNYDIQYRIILPDQSIRYIHPKGRVTRDKNGKPIRFFGTVLDVTKRKQDEENLLHTMEKAEIASRDLLQIMNSSPDFIFKSRIDNFKFTAVNKTACDFYGYSQDEFLQMDILDIEVEPSLREQVRKLYDMTPVGKMIEVYGTNKKKNGKTFPVHVRFVKLDEVFAMANVSDITAQKLAEEKIHDYHGRLRALTSELSLSEERQRRKFATQLHDHIGQLLAVSKMKLAALRQNLQSIEIAELDEIHDFLDQAIEYTRSVTVELSPPVLYEFGLDAAIEELLENTQKTHHIQVHFDHDELEKPLDPDAKIVLFQAVRELLHNVVKHAHAKQINASSKIVHDHIEITVQDDGVGFDPDHLHSPDNHNKAFGLFNIRERIDMLDGSILIDTQPGQGTHVRLQTPLAQKNNPLEHST